MCLLFECDYETKNREMVPMYSVLSGCVDPAFTCSFSDIYLTAWKICFIDCIRDCTIKASGS